MVCHPQRWECQHELRLLSDIFSPAWQLHTDHGFATDFCGTIIGAPVIPIMLVVLWPKLTNAAVLASSGGTLLALMAWLLTCRYYYGSLSVDLLVANYSSLAGSLTSMGSGAIIAVVVSLFKPDDYDFTGTRASM